MSNNSIFFYKNNFLTKLELNNLKTWLTSKYYYSGNIGNNKIVPRKQIWYQENGCYFNKMWKKRYDRWEGKYYDSYLKTLQDKIQKEVEATTTISDKLKIPKFNSCLINLYKNENSSIAAHKDSPTSFGEFPLIVILSVGETRTIKFKKVLYDVTNPLSCKLDLNNQNLNKEFELEDNSLFIMGGNSQSYTHQIDKEKTKEKI